MPLTPKGEEIKNAMQKEYGEERGTEIFYASRNKGTISGVDTEPPLSMPVEPGISIADVNRRNRDRYK